MKAAAAWVRFSERRALTLLALGTAIAALGGYGTVRLYSDLRTDAAELLPGGARSARDAAVVAERVGSWAEETVALYGPEPEALRRFADALAPRLSAIPGVVASVEYRVDEVQRFFHERRWLFLSTADLQELRDRLDRMDKTTIDAAIERISAANRGTVELFERFPDGYFLRETQDPAGRPTHALVIRVRLAGNPNDYPRLETLDREVRKAAAALKAERTAEPISIAYGGYVASTKFEHDGLLEDLVVATTLVMLAVALVIALYFRTAKAVIVIGVPLQVGTLAAFGLADVAVGHVNSNTAFLGSIVIGNGINAGLMLFARYAEERRRGEAPGLAMITAVGTTWLATLTASLGAGIAYGSLIVTDFRGFKQFGIIGGIGMAVCWLATYAFLPALALAWERRGTLIAPHSRGHRGWLIDPIAALIERRPRLIAVVAMGLGVASTFFVARFAMDPMEYDFGKLRDSRALDDGGPQFWEDAVFGGHHDPCVVLAADEREAREVAAGYEAHRAVAKHRTIGRVVSIASFVPSDQPARLKLLQELRSYATEENLRILSDKSRQKVLPLIPPPDLGPFTAAELPAQVRARLTTADGAIGAPVLVYPADWVSVWDGRHALKVAEDLRTAPLRDDLPRASSLLLFADILEAIAKDGPLAVGVSFAGVVLLVLVLFRAGSREGLKDAALVVASLVAGVLLFGGAAGALGIKLNMLNFIALPITFGIGVDYGANVVQRRRQTGASVGECLRTTGGAVMLCSLTTVIGYSSLLVAHNQALRSFGILACLGELATLTAALLVVPLFGRWK
ncbi:MAG: exporters of the superfamily [Myxococcaceae bacterium]|nr:exporters of the superfamily [Myxococcaceae bacterium]